MEPTEPSSDARRALRAQLLATEHWSLLASRSTTQSEVLSRVTIFLTLVSAGLVTLGILGQLGNDERDLGWVVVGVLAFLLLVGIMTQARVVNGMTDDLMYVVAMNRLRGAYVELEPEVARYLMASPYDDEPGIGVTYHFFGRSDRSQVFASLGLFVQVVNVVLAGLTIGAVLVALGAPLGWAVAAGFGAAAVALALDLRQALGAWQRARAGYTPLRPTPAA